MSWRDAAAVPAEAGRPVLPLSRFSDAGGDADLDFARRQRGEHPLTLEQEDRVDDPGQHMRLSGRAGQDEVVIARMGAEVQDGLVAAVSLDVDRLAAQGPDGEHPVVARM